MRSSTFIGVAAFFLIRAAAPAADLEGTLAKVATYEYGQSRSALVELAAIVGEAMKSPEQAKALEARFDAFLEGQATRDGKDQICRHLSLAGTEASVPVLSKLLAAEDTREMARYALERLPGQAADEALRAALGTTTGKSRAGVAGTLGMRRDAKAVPLLAGLLTDADAADAAAAALGRIATVEAADALKQAEGTVQGGVRLRVMEARLDCAGAFAKAGDTARARGIYDELNGASQPGMIRTAALSGLAASFGASALPALTAAIDTGNEKTRAAAIRLLGRIPGPEATAALAGRVQKAPVTARVQLVAALGERGDKAGAAAVLGALKDGDVAVRAAALEALGSLGDTSAVELLASAAAESADPEQAAARQSLYRLRGAGVDENIAALIPKADGKKKVELMRAAGERGSTAASQALIAAAGDADRAVRREAMKALRETAAGEQVPALLKLLAKAEPSDRKDAERALSSALRRSNNAGIQDVTAAYGSTRNTETRASLLLVMGQAGHEDSLAMLRAALGDSNADLRRAAILGLTEWPTGAPLEDLLGAAKNPVIPAHQVLALRGYIRLLALPSERSAGETAALLGKAIELATQPDEKKAALALLPKYASPEALKVAEGVSDPAVAKETRSAAERVRRLLAEK